MSNSSYQWPIKVRNFCVYFYQIFIIRRPTGYLATYLIILYQTNIPNIFPRGHNQLLFLIRSSISFFQSVSPYKQRSVVM